MVVCRKEKENEDVCTKEEEEVVCRKERVVCRKEEEEEVVCMKEEE